MERSEISVTLSNSLLSGCRHADDRPLPPARVIRQYYRAVTGDVNYRRIHSGHQYAGVLPDVGDIIRLDGDYHARTQARFITLLTLASEYDLWGHFAGLADAAWLRVEGNDVLIAGSRV